MQILFGAVVCALVQHMQLPVLLTLSVNCVPPGNLLSPVFFPPRFYHHPRQSMWKLIHFLVSGGEVVNSNLYADIEASVLETILTRPVAGTTAMYVDYMVAEDVVTSLTRVRHLFSCFLETRASVTKYEEFEAKLFEAWTTKFTSESVMLVVFASDLERTLAS